MLIGFQLGQTSIVLRVKIFDSTPTSPTLAGKTGLTNSSSGLIISTIADNEASPTVYTAAASHVQSISTLGTFAAPSASCCRFGKIDDTNHPGLCEIQLDNSRYAVSNAKSLTITLSGVTGMAQCDVTVPLTSTNPYDGVHGGMTALPNTACTTNASLLTSGTGTDQLSVSHGIAQTPNGPIVRTGTAQTNGTAGQITLDSGASSTSSVYNGMVVTIVSGTGSNPPQTNLIVTYNGSTKVATLASSWNTNPDNTSVFVISLLPLANLLQWFWSTLAGPDAQGYPSVNVADWKGSGAPAMTGDAYARLGAPAGASVSADIAAVKGVLPTALTGAGNLKADALAINGLATSSVTTVNANVGTTQPTNFTGTGGSALVQTDVTDWKASTAPAMTGDAYARLGAPAGASVSADIAAVKTDTGTTIPGRLPTALTGGGNIKADAVAIGGSTSTPANLTAMCLSYVQGSIPSGTPTTGGFVGNSGLSTTNGDYARAFLVFTSGVNQGIGRAVSTYTGSTKTFAFTGSGSASDAPFPAAPSVGDTFIIIGRAANGT